MRPTLPIVLILTACGSNEAPHPAAATFSAFQRALQQRDEAALGQLVTAASTPVIAELPWERIQQQQPLQVLGTTGTPSPSRTLVDVADPNHGGRRSQFVVVRENGRLRVDLIESAGMHAQAVEATADAGDFEPRELTPADLDRIRQRELATPPRER